MNLKQHVDDALMRIQFVLDTMVTHPNQVVSAYSGGKDSRAVLTLARKVLPKIIAVYNGHPGEDFGEETVLIVKEPKAVHVPQFLASVDIKVQLDGTRRDEDKDVVFGGKLIHRSAMPTSFTEKGVWGLAVMFPIWDWTEETVLEFLRSEGVRIP